MKALSLIILSVLAAAAFAQTQVPADSNTPETPAPTAAPAEPDQNTSTTTKTSTTGSTTTQAPAPSTTTAAPAPTAGKWNVTNKAEKLCLMVKLGATFTFNYTDSAEKNQTYKVNLPANETSSSGSCGEDPANSTTQNIKLTFDTSCSMTLNFEKVKTKFYVKLVDVSFDTSCFPDKMQPKQAVTGKITSSELFKATVGQSYMCNSDQSVKTNSSAIQVDFVDVQVQAFANEDKFEFGAAQECPQDAETSNIVPIAVGAALAALVLIVLIAYLISRNRGQRGYESV